MRYTVFSTAIVLQNAKLLCCTKNSEKLTILKWLLEERNIISILYSLSEDGNLVIRPLAEVLNLWFYVLGIYISTVVIPKLSGTLSF